MIASSSGYARCPSGEIPRTVQSEIRRRLPSSLEFRGERIGGGMNSRWPLVAIVEVERADQADFLHAESAHSTGPADLESVSPFRP